MLPISVNTFLCEGLTSVFAFVLYPQDRGTAGSYTFTNIWMGATSLRECPALQQGMVSFIV